VEYGLISFSLSRLTKDKPSKEGGTSILGRTTIRFASLEDLVIHKLIAGRARDIEDVKSILAKNPKYDSNEIAKWLREFDRSLEENFLKTFRKIEKESG
jgi:hypothetical protein